MSDLDHKTNFLTTIAAIVGGLSLTDHITFVVGLIVLLMAAINNYFSIKRHGAGWENEKRKQKYYDAEK